MKLFKKIILAMLVVRSVSPVAFGMGEASVEFDKNEFKKLQGQQLQMFVAQNDIEKVKKHLADMPEEERASIVTGCYAYRPEYKYLSNDSDGYKNMTALHIAVASGFLEMVHILLEAAPEAQRPAFVMTRDEDGCTVLHNSVRSFEINLEIIRILLYTVSIEQRAEFVMSKCSYGATVLHNVITICRHDWWPWDLRKLINLFMDAIPEEQRASVVMDKSEYFHSTVLHYAIARCYSRHEEEDRIIAVMRAILLSIPSEQRGVVLMDTDQDQTLLDNAKKYGLEKIINMLAEFYPQQQAPVKVEEEERPSKKRNRDGECGDSGAPAQKVREKEQPKDSGWGCNVM
ncbi:MAG: ankyrin repeat domain-containing protein [bacterium]